MTKVHAYAAIAIMAIIAHGHAAITGSIPAIPELTYILTPALLGIV